MYTPSDQNDLTVVRNREAWLKKYGLELSQTSRVHITYEGDNYCRYRIVDASEKGDGMETSAREPADALVVTSPGHSLFLPVADCVATTLYDEEHGVLMLSHLGRHSLEQQGGVKSVEFLVQHFGTRPERLTVWLSPAPNKEVYPIFKLDNKGMKEAAFEQLQVAGVRLENIIDAPADTATDAHYFSHSEFLKGNKESEGRFAMIAYINAK